MENIGGVNRQGYSRVPESELKEIKTGENRGEDLGVLEQRVTDFERIKEREIREMHVDRQGAEETKPRWIRQLEELVEAVDAYYNRRDLTAFQRGQAANLRGRARAMLSEANQELNGSSSSCAPCRDLCEWVSANKAMIGCYLFAVCAAAALFLLAHDS